MIEHINSRYRPLTGVMSGQRKEDLGGSCRSNRQANSQALTAPVETATRTYFPYLLLLFIISVLIAITPVRAGALEDKFRTSDEKSTIQIDHSRWQGLLKTYVKQGSDGLNRVNYAAFKQMGRKSLKSYLNDLQAVDVPTLNKNEQFAYWANLYNAQTIEIILAHYPVKTIRDIDISPGIFADGPWKKQVLTVGGIKISLDDIEHKILRGFFKDPRVHYAVNCASVGCPNLGRDAFTGPEIESQLNASARAYVNSPRGVSVKGRRVTVSKIYSWFDEDFGNSERGVLAHIRKYADAGLAKDLKGLDDIYDYDYDWSLNDSRAHGL